MCTTARRVQMLEACREAGIPTMVWLSPILPFLNDTEENLMGLLRYCAGRGEANHLLRHGPHSAGGNREYFSANWTGISPAFRTATGAAMEVPTR